MANHMANARSEVAHMLSMQAEGSLSSVFGRVRGSLRQYQRLHPNVFVCILRMSRRFFFFTINSGLTACIASSKRLLNCSSPTVLCQRNRRFFRQHNGVSFLCAPRTNARLERKRDLAVCSPFWHLKPFGLHCCRFSGGVLSGVVLIFIAKSLVKR